MQMRYIDEFIVSNLNNLQMDVYSGCPGGFLMGIAKIKTINNSLSYTFRRIIATRDQQQKYKFGSKYNIPLVSYNSNIIV